VDDTIAEATVRVRADGCGPRTELGTGTSIGDGLVVTAAHVVAGADRVEVVDPSGDTTPAEVVMFDPVLDVATLRPNTDPGPPAPLRADPASEGETGVIAIPSANGSIELVDVEVVQRVTILTTDIYRDEQVQRPGLRVAVTVEPGDSGAMVHLAGGGVGIVWSRSTERSDQAWTVDLPDELRSPASRRALMEPVDTGPCP
jgi:S1-C subfamily serine protease